MLKGYRHPQDIILQSVRWHLRYSLSHRDIEELLEERGVFVDHASIFRWVHKAALARPGTLAGVALGRDAWRPTSDTLLPMS